MTPNRGDATGYESRRIAAHGRRSRGSGCSPTKLLGEQVHSAPQFFCNLQLKVTVQTVRLRLTQKLSTIPQLLGLSPDLIIYRI